MRVTTPITDLDVTIASLRVKDGALVMENAATDAMKTCAVLEPSDVRLVLRAVLRPSVIWFAFTSAFRPAGPTPRATQKPIEDHPTANPW